jgi:oligopeptidase B
VPPIAAKRRSVRTIHGDVRADDYHWLKNRDDPAVIAYLEEENRYTQSSMEHTQALQERLYQELLSRIQEDDASVPYRMDDWWYYSRTERGQAYRIYCRKHGSLEAPEQIILDVNELAQGRDYLSLGALEVSPNHEWLAFSIDREGDERFVLRFKNLRTGETLPESIVGTSYTLAWANDDRTIFYAVLDGANRPFRLYRHVLGTDPESDPLIYEETDERFFLWVYRTRSDAFILMDLESAISSEVHFLDAGDPLGTFTMVEPRQQGVEYDVEHHGDRFFIRANQNAMNFALYETPVERPSREQWRVVLPHREDVMLEDMLAFARHLVLMERKDGLPQIRVRPLDGAAEHLIAFDEPTYECWAAVNEEFETDLFRFAFTSPITPLSTFDYDLANKTRDLKKREIVIGHDPTRYRSERIFARADDGTRIPISLVYRVGTPRDGTAPILLHVYGAYGYSNQPSFAPNWLSLLDRGISVGIAHVRGGGEMGRVWRDGGRLENKINTFTDFIRCAELLIAEKYTSASRIGIMGLSAGGLAIGGALNMRPDLFHVAIAGVPFVDVVNTMLDETLPLTVVEWEEWGNPNLEKDYREILAYSPYDNVKPQRYPNLLVIAGLNDPRVGYWEPAKWVAKLRATKTDANLLLLRTNMGAGHGGASNRYQRFRERAFDYAFLLERFGISE